MKKEDLLWLFATNKTITLLGGKGSGKTNMSAVFMKDLVEYGYQCFTNIHFFKLDDVGKAINQHKLKSGIDYKMKPSQIHVVSSLSELLLGLCSKGKKVVFIDEAGISVATGVTKSTKQMVQLAYILRHFDACIVFIAQTRGSLPPDIREKLCDIEMETGYARQDGKRYRIITLSRTEIAMDDYNNKYTNFIPFDKLITIPTDIPFDSNYPTGFDVDMKLETVLKELSKLGNSMEVEKHGRAVIQRLIPPEPPEPKPDIDDLLKFYVDGSMTAKEIATKCKVTEMTVYRHINKSNMKVEKK